MTIPNTVNVLTAVGPQSSPLSLPFLVVQQADVVVFLQSAAGVTPVKLTLATDYGVTSLNQLSGAFLTFNPTGAIGTSLATGAILTISRDPAQVQTTALQAQGPFPAPSVQQITDQLTTEVQANRTRINNSLQAPLVESLNGLSLTLPLAATRAGNAFLWDVSGQPTVGALTPPGTIPTVSIVQVVDTIAALKAVAVPLVAVTYYVRGYYAIGDGGGGFFEWNASDAAADNAGTIIAITANGSAAGRMDRIITEIGINVTWFGTKVNDLTYDNTAAFNAAVVWSMAHNNSPIYVPVGQYMLAGNVLIPNGIAIICAGSQGSTQQCGTTFLHNSNGNCFSWDATTATAFCGTGGGLRNCLIIKGAAYSGGYGIYVYAASDNFRPGEMYFENILIQTNNPGQWTSPIYIDGHNCSTSGSEGVRSVIMNKVRVSGGKTANQYVVLNQVVHFSAFHLAVDQGNGSAAAGITVLGDSINVMLLLDNTGSLVVDSAANVLALNVYGQCQSLAQNAIGTTGSFNATTQTVPLVNKSIGFLVSGPLSPAFESQLTTAQNSVTGDGTAFPVTGYSTVDYNTNADFVNTTGIFTCTVAGIYEFHAQVDLKGLASGHTAGILQLSRAGAASQTKDAAFNPYAMSGGSDGSTFAVDGKFQLVYGDTVQVVLTVSGGAKAVGVQGDSSNYATRFSGQMLRR